MRSILSLIFLIMPVMAWAQSCDQVLSQPEIYKCVLTEYVSALEKLEDTFTAMCIPKKSREEQNDRFRKYCIDKLKNDKGGSAYMTFFYLCLTKETNQYISYLGLASPTHCK